MKVEISQEKFGRLVLGCMATITMFCGTHLVSAQPIIDPPDKIETGVYKSNLAPNETGTKGGPNEGWHNGNVALTFPNILATWNSQTISTNYPESCSNPADRAFGPGGLFLTVPVVCAKRTAPVLRDSDGVTQPFGSDGKSRKAYEGDLRQIAQIEGGYEVRSDATANPIVTRFTARVSNSWGEFYLPTKVTNPDGSWVEFSYDLKSTSQYALPVTMQYSNGDLIKFTNDSTKVTSVTFLSPEGSLTYTLQYMQKAGMPQLSAITHPDGSSEYIKWSSQGYIIKTIGTKGETTNISYFKIENPDSLFNGMPVLHSIESFPGDSTGGGSGWRTVFAFSPAVETVSLQGGVPYRYSKTLLTEVKTQGGAELRPKEYYEGFDAADNVLVNSWAYDADGRLVSSTWGPGQVTKFTYNSAVPFLVEKVGNPDGTSQEYSYNGAPLAYAAASIKEMGSDGAVASVTTLTYKGGNDDRVASAVTFGAGGESEKTTYTYEGSFNPTTIVREGSSKVDGYTETNLPTGYSGPGGRSTMAWNTNGSPSSVGVNGFVTTFKRTVDASTGTEENTADNRLAKTSRNSSFDGWPTSEFRSYTEMKTGSGGGGGDGGPVTLSPPKRAPTGWVCEHSELQNGCVSYASKDQFIADGYQEASCSQCTSTMSGIDRSNSGSGNAYPVQDCSNPSSPPPTASAVPTGAATGTPNVAPTGTPKVAPTGTPLVTPTTKSTINPTIPPVTPTKGGGGGTIPPTIPGGGGIQTPVVWTPNTTPAPRPTWIIPPTFTPRKTATPRPTGTPVTPTATPVVTATVVANVTAVCLKGTCNVTTR